MKTEQELKKEKELIKSVKKNKQEFSKIYRHYYPIMVGYIRKRTKKKEVSEDLASEVFEKAYKAIDDFKWQGVTLSAWIFRIGKNLLTDYYRKESKRSASVSLTELENFVEDEEVSVIRDAISDEEERVLYDALREFREEDQYLIYYKFFEGLSNKAIAEITGLGESNVGTRLYRIRRRLRNILKKKGISLT